MEPTTTNTHSQPSATTGAHAPPHIPAPDAPIEGTPNANPNKRKRSKKKKKWVKTNTWVYITGLPSDTTMDELLPFVAKCGLVKTAFDTGEPKVKLYTDDDGKPKGDASVCYLKKESVELALTLLDGSDFRPGCTVKVEKAEFQQKGDEYVEKKPVVDEKMVKLRKLQAQQALSWNEQGLDDKMGLKMVVLSNVFDPAEFKADPNFEKELQEDMADGLGQIGEVKKITLFEKHPEGVLVVKYYSSVSAEKCIQSMNGRFYNGRKICADYWDGKTDFRHKISEEEENERIKSFREYLEAGDDDDDVE